MVGNAGVSGASLTAGGPDLRAECSLLGFCSSGQVRITLAHRLPARHVIHAVAPVWYGGHEGVEVTLTQCYQRCFELMEQFGHRTVAFSCIGTGAHGIPVPIASRIAVTSMLDFLRRDIVVEMISIVCFQRSIYEEYVAALARYGPP